jgi:hypothetical protein
VRDRAARGAWARGRRRGSPEQGFRGGASPELAELGLPRVNSIVVWVREDQHVRRKPPGPKAGRGEVLNAGRECGGGSARQSLPAQRVRSVFVPGQGV